MPDYLAHVFEGLQAGAAVGHMMRQSQQADEANRRMQLQSDRQYEEQKQRMASQDLAERENLNKNAIPVSPAGTVTQMMPAIEGSGGGPDIPSAPGVMKADASRTVKYGGQSYQLMTPEEQSSRALKSTEAVEKMKAGVEAQKKLDELRNTTANEPQIAAGDYVGGIMGIDPKQSIPMSRYAAIARAGASIENAQSLRAQREAKPAAIEDPVMSNHPVETDDGGYGLVVVHKSGKQELLPVAGAKPPGAAAARQTAAVANRQAANEDRIDARAQQGRAEKDAGEALKLDRQIQGYEVGVKGLTGALTKPQGERVTFINEKGKPETTTLTPDVVDSLKQRADAAAQTRDQLKGQRDVYARKLGWGTTKPSTSSTAAGGSGAAATPQAQAAPVKPPAVGQKFKGPDGKMHVWDGMTIKDVQ